MKTFAFLMSMASVLALASCGHKISAENVEADTLLTDTVVYDTVVADTVPVDTLF